MPANRSGHSAEVRLRLLVGDRSFDLAKVGPQSCFVCCPDDIPPGKAEISVTIDGTEHRRDVVLVDGLSRHDQITNLMGR